MSVGRNTPSGLAYGELPSQSRRNREPVKPLPDLIDRIAYATSEDEQNQVVDVMFDLAQEIWELVKLKQSNNGVLPRGTLSQAAHKLGKSEDQIARLIRKMERHELDRQAGKHNKPRAFAVVLGQQGRQKGKRDYPPEVIQFIVDAWRNPDWQSLNRFGLTDSIHCRLSKTMVHKLVQHRFPNIKISLMTVCRIIDDFEQNNGAKAAYGRGKESEAKEHLTSINADFGHPNNTWILDIRPLPVKSKYKGIECTAGLLVLMDAASTNALGHKLLPRQDVDDEGNTFGVDFTCQHVRFLIALTIVKLGRRPRYIYVDNGSQFGKALEKFLDLLTAEGEEPTQLHRPPPETPQGKGLIERCLGLIDEFAQFKPGFFEEDDYRRSLKRKKKYTFYEFSSLEAEFDHFFSIRNTTRKETKAKKVQLSPAERYEQGPDQGLAPSSIVQLGLFAGSAKRIQDKIPSREGVRYDNKHYALLDEDPEIGAKLAGMARNRQKRPVFVITFKDLVVLYVKLDEHQWVLFVEKDKRQWSAKKQRAWKDSVQRHLADDQQAAEARLQMALVNDVGERLVIDPYRKDFALHQGKDADTSQEPVEVDGQRPQSSSHDTVQATPRKRRREISALPSSRTAKHAPPSSQSRNQTSSSPALKGHAHPEIQGLGVDEEDDDDDIPNFMLLRMEELRKQQAKE